MIEQLDKIGDFLHGQPWLALGTALLCLLAISSALAYIERRKDRLSREHQRHAEDQLRSKDT